ncbi:MAG: 4-hydroxy-tetrahydrodipicolinate reductase [Woeseiaceae bacterium]
MANIRIGIAGAGRMGQAIAQSVESADDLELAGIWQRGGALDDVLSDADVLIDFSLPEANTEVLQAALDHHRPLVCGVSGLSDDQLAALRSASSALPIVFDRNMSQGITVLNDVVKRVAASLGGEFDIEIHETHHAHKLDSPSGTALQLADSIAAAKGVDRDAAGISFEVERRGDVPGDHCVILASPTEKLSFGHSVATRQVFVAGALRAARWLVGKPSGLYDMSDVLFDEQ